MTTVARYNACPVRAELCAAARSEAELIEAPASAIKAYIAQLSGAKWRGIEFKMTFTEWWNWWQVDGRWDNRGSGPENFLMARHGDIGPYAIGNIYCATKRENSSARWPAEIREIIVAERRNRPERKPRRQALVHEYTLGCKRDGWMAMLLPGR